MVMTIVRRQKARLERLLGQFPAVGLLGPRQAGKTTLALEIAGSRPAVYLDLESPRDRARLADPDTYFDENSGKLLVLDEVQRAPGLFQSLRGAIDRANRSGRKNGLFLLLGSAAIDLLKQSGETLAGRIVYLELSPFDALEVDDLNRLWVRGGFPPSFLAADDAASFLWRESFIRTYLERDIPQFGPRIAAETLRRFWTMLAHNQAQLFNAAALARALGIDAKTVAAYLDLMTDLLLVRRLPAWHGNDRKRLVKSPKVYIRDSGLVHTLLNIRTKDDLLGHPVAGQSWESFVAETLIGVSPDGTEHGFYRSAAGAEIDLLLKLPNGALWAIEIKRSSAPDVERGFFSACEDLNPSERYVVYPGTEEFPLRSGVRAIGLHALSQKIARQS